MFHHKRINIIKAVFTGHLEQPAVALLDQVLFIHEELLRRIEDMIKEQSFLDRLNKAYC